MSDIPYYVNLINGRPECKCSFKGKCFHEFGMIDSLNLNDHKKISEKSIDQLEDFFTNI